MLLVSSMALVRRSHIDIPLHETGDRVQDYLRTNQDVEKSDAFGAANAGRHLCDGMHNKVEKSKR